MMAMALESHQCLHQTVMHVLEMMKIKTLSAVKSLIRPISVNFSRVIVLDKEHAHLRIFKSLISSVKSLSQMKEDKVTESAMI